MSTRRRLLLPLLTYLTLALAAALAVRQTLPPAPLPSTAPMDQFSAARAAQHISAISRAGIRRVGFAPFNQARDYVAARLTNLSLKPEIQTAPGVENIVAALPGAQSQDAVLLVAHLDTVSLGATDDGSGVAVLLETARALRSGPPLRNTILLLFTAPEENCCSGAVTFLTQHPSARQVKLVLNFDAGGLGGPSVLSATSPNNGWLIRGLAQAGPGFIANSAMASLADSRTDFTLAFRKAGLSGLGFDLYWDKRIHSRFDTVENLSLPSLQDQGSHALALARYFGSLEHLQDTKEPNPVYFDVLRQFIVVYPASLAVIISLLAALGLLGLLVYGIRRGLLSGRGVARGGVIFLLELLLTPLVALAADPLIQLAIARYKDQALYPLLHVSAAVLVALLSFSTLYILAQKRGKTGILDLYTGALLVIALAMLASALVFPPISFAFTWPLLAVLFAAAYWLSALARNRPANPALVLLLAGIASTLLLVPLLLLAAMEYLTLSLVFLVVLLGLLLPVGPLGFENP